MASSSFFTLEKLPDSSDIHIWADFVELRCLTDPDLMVSKSDVQSYVQERKDLRKGLNDYSDDEDSDAEDDVSQLPVDMKRAARAEDLFKHLEYRAGAFADFYPFTLSKDGDLLRRRSRVTMKHKLYVFLLLSSNLSHIRNLQYRGKFTEAFEVVSVAALKNYLPKDAEVHLFGTNSLNKGRYSVGQLLKRIRLLADHLGEQFVGNASEFSPHDTGDNGLDVVGWIPVGDNARGFLLVFGQCACSYDEWPKKQHSSSASHWRKIINFLTPPSNMIFIPFCYRHNSGKWHKERWIDEAILMDRLRLIELLRDGDRQTIELPYNLINEAIEQRNGSF